ncbi:hypothetical protein D3C80_1739400 [compost metagenome]
MVTGQAGFAARFHRVQFEHGAAGLRAHTDPVHPALLRHPGEQFMQRAHRLMPTSNSTVRPRLLRRNSGASAWANSTRA